MGLFVSTVSGNVALPELGITLTHPTTNYDLTNQFDVDSLRRCASLTSAIQGGTLTWKKTSGGSVEPASDYDPEYTEVDADNTGSGNFLDRAVTFKDFADLAKQLEINSTTWVETPTYLGNGDIDYIEWTKAGVRRMRVDFTYDANLMPLTETWKFYDTNGTTILRTVTKTYAYSGITPTSVTSVYS